MITEHIDREEALRVFSRRFNGLSEEEVAERFDDLLAAGFLDFRREPDGLRVMLTGRKARQ
jgi:hypothetical protein